MVLKLPVVPGVVQRFLRASREEEPPGLCRRGCHVLHTQGLRLQTPTAQDMRIMLAAASDPQARRWLGLAGSVVIPERDVEQLLARPAGRGRALSRAPGPQSYLVAIDPAAGRVAGAIGVEAIGVDGAAGEVGGWLAPRYRGHGL